MTQYMVRVERFPQVRPKKIFCTAQFCCISNKIGGVPYKNRKFGNLNRPVKNYANSHTARIDSRKESRGRFIPHCLSSSKPALGFKKKHVFEALREITLQPKGSNRTSRDSMTFSLLLARLSNELTLESRKPSGPLLPAI